MLFYSKTQRQQPEVLVSKPYRNWKDFRSDIRSHSITTSHRTAKARMDAFISTYGKPSSQISFMLSSSEKDIVKKNQEFLTSIIKCVEFCGRQGIKAISEVYLISASMLVIKYLKSIWQRIQRMHHTFPKQHRMNS